MPEERRERPTVLSAWSPEPGELPDSPIGVAVSFADTRTRPEKPTGALLGACDGRVARQRMMLWLLVAPLLDVISLAVLIVFDVAESAELLAGPIALSDPAGPLLS